MESDVFVGVFCVSKHSPCELCRPSEVKSACIALHFRGEKNTACMHGLDESSVEKCALIRIAGLRFCTTDHLNV